MTDTLRDDDDIFEKLNFEDEVLIRLSNEIRRESDKRQTLTRQKRTMQLKKIFEDRQHELETGPPKAIYDAKIRDYTEKDAKDVLSVEPSYTEFKIPYSTQCKLRYIASKNKMEKKFQKELKQLEIYQPSAYAAIRLIRHMAITTLWPPLHNPRETERLEKFFELTSKQKKHLRYLMDNEQY